MIVQSRYKSVTPALWIVMVSWLMFACRSSTPEWTSQDDTWRFNVSQTVADTWQPSHLNSGNESDLHAENPYSNGESAEYAIAMENGLKGSVRDTVAEESEQDSIHVLPGFDVQLLYNVPRGPQGSWVSLGMDEEGRLIASDQQEKGFYRITVTGETDAPEVNVEETIMPISGAYGLLWAFDHLYANVNGRGLFRLHDSRDNDQFNILEYLGGPVNNSEHGNHTIVKTADGKGLYFIAGNHTPPPDELDSSRVPTWEEDSLLPRMWDARGHARGILAPGGYFARTNPDATEWEMFSIGYRNQYDAAINEHGELFTFDSDMEWEMGMPWYRPTAIVHVTSGSDYGWRSGSGKWPDYFEDKLPPVLNIGPASPTGVLFGTGARFPARYQRAMFALDWTFGTIYAIHFTPEGASYRAEAEEFLSGSPLPLTSAVIGHDGALYFITGGRNQDSQLYRVIYRGDESTAPAEPADDPQARAARELRHELEAFHGREDREALEIVWPHLDSEDRILRYAARVAVESQPADWWAEKAVTEERPQARITAIVALARTGSGHHRAQAIQSLLELDMETLSAEQKLGMLRAMSLIFMRLGDPDEQEWAQITDMLVVGLPDGDDRVNAESVRLLVYLEDSRVIGEALALMRNEKPPELPDWGGLLVRNERYGGVIQEMIENPPPIRELNFAFMLRTVREGWTIEQRREYFQFINDAAGRMGGMSYSGHLTDIRNDALDHADDDEREAVADITGVSLAQAPDFDIRAPEGPGREWTLEEAVGVVSGQLRERNFENGRNAFFVTSCAACHRFDSYGGSIGPDLGTVGRRFSVGGLLEKIIDPNILISDQYSSSEVLLRNGERIIGLAFERDNNIEIYTQNPNDPPTLVARDDVQSIEPVDVSQMPPGLINTLNAEELRDLIAYLQSGGDPEHEMFRVEKEEDEEDEAEVDEDDEDDG